MGRRAKPTKGKAAAKRPFARKSPTDDRTKVRDLEKRLAEALRDKEEAQEQLRTRDRELVDAHDQQRATSEILRVISSSPTDVQPVFDAIAESGRRLCDGDFCNVARYEGGLIHLSAHAQTTSETLDALQRMFPMAPTRATTFGRTILERAVVYIGDVREEPKYSQALAEAHRAPSALGVPMLRDGPAHRGYRGWGKGASAIQRQADCVAPDLR